MTKLLYPIFFYLSLLSQEASIEWLDQGLNSGDSQKISVEISNIKLYLFSGAGSEVKRGFFRLHSVVLRADQGEFPEKIVIVPTNQISNYNLNEEINNVPDNQGGLFSPSVRLKWIAVYYNESGEKQTTESLSNEIARIEDRTAPPAVQFTASNLFWANDSLWINYHKSSSDSKTRVEKVSGLLAGFPSPWTYALNVDLLRTNVNIAMLNDFSLRVRSEDNEGNYSYSSIVNSLTSIKNPVFNQSDLIWLDQGLNSADNQRVLIHYRMPKGANKIRIEKIYGNGTGLNFTYSAWFSSNGILEIGNVNDDQNVQFRIEAESPLGDRALSESQSYYLRDRTAPENLQINPLNLSNNLLRLNFSGTDIHSTDYSLYRNGVIYSEKSSRVENNEFFEVLTEEGSYSFSIRLKDEEGNYVDGVSSNQSYNLPEKTIDALTYEYDSKERLNKVTDAYPDKGYKTENTGQFYYDPNGNMIKDENRGLNQLTYNNQNLIEEMLLGNSDLMTYLYNNDGQRLLKKRNNIIEGIYVRGASGEILGELEGLGEAEKLYFDYIIEGSLIIHSNLKTETMTGSGSASLSFDSSDLENGIDFTLGLESCSDLSNFEIGQRGSELSYRNIIAGNETIGQERNGKEYYYLKDHLGNNRAIIKDENGVAELAASTDYYPYGMVMPERELISSIPEDQNKFKYQGKERDKESGLDYFEARYYDAGIAQFRSVDAMADKYSFINPYSSMTNSPLMIVDPTGLFSEYYSKNGDLILQYDDNDNNAYLLNNLYITTNGKLIIFADLLAEIDDFHLVSSAAYAEGSNVFKEFAAIAWTIQNYKTASGKEYSEILNSSNPYSSAFRDGNKRLKNYNNTEINSKTSLMKKAISGAIHMFSGGEDFSNGALYWDGPDFDYNNKNHFKAKKGVKFTKECHNIYGCDNTFSGSGGKRDPFRPAYIERKWVPSGTYRGHYYHVYESTAAHGKTMFWKLTDDYKKAEGVRY
jgi:RHS repeat-associated protein